MIRPLILFLLARCRRNPLHPLPAKPARCVEHNQSWSISLMKINEGNGEHFDEVVDGNYHEGYDFADG